MAESIHERLERVRKPRVHIKYEVETEGGVLEKDLPFVVGVIGDFSGDPTQPLRSLSERKFIQIDRGNFDDVMKRMTPGVNMRVENTIAGDGSEMVLQLKFNSMSDFEPANVVNQVEPLRKLKDTRNRLRDLMSKVDRSEKLEAMLEQVLENRGQLEALRGDFGPEAPDGAPETTPEPDKENK